MAARSRRDRTVRYDAGQVVFREGDRGREMFVIREGRVRISKQVLDANKTLDTLSKGDFFGEMALIEGLPRSATASVVEKATLQIIDEDGFARLMGNGGTMALRILRELSARLREADRQIETLLLKDEEGRVVHTLSSLSTVYGRKEPDGIRFSRTFSTEEIGDLANVSNRIARRVLLRLQSAGFLHYSEGSILLKSPAELRSFLTYLNWRSKAFR